MHRYTEGGSDHWQIETVYVCPPDKASLGGQCVQTLTQKAPGCATVSLLYRDPNTDIKMCNFPGSIV